MASAAERVLFRLIVGTAIMAGGCDSPWRAYAATAQSEATAAHAEAAARHDLDRAKSSGDAADQANANEKLGQALRAANRPAEAASAFIEAARLWLQAHDRSRQGKALHAAAFARVRQGEYIQARELYEQALNLLEAIGPDIAFAACLADFGTLLGRIGAYAAAETRLSEAIGLANRIGAPGVLRTAQNSLANVYLYQGRHQEARSLYLALLASLANSGNRALEASVLSNLGNSYYRTDHMGEAERYNEMGLAAAQALGDLEKQAASLTMRALLRDRRGDLDSAVESGEAALNIRRQIGDGVGVATALNNLASFFGDKKYGARTDFTKAAGYFREAADIQHRLGHLEGAASSLNNLGATETNRGAYDAAEAALLEAAGIYRRIGNRRQLSNALGNIGFNFTQQKRYAEAIPYYAESVDLFESLRSSILDDSERVSFFAAATYHYNTLVDLLMEAGRAEDAFRVAERARGRALLDLLSAARPRLIASIPPDLRRRERLAREELARTERRLHELSNGSDSTALTSIVAARDAALSSVVTIDQQIRRSVPEYERLVASVIPDIATIQRQLVAPDEAILVFSPHGRRLQTFIVVQDRFHAQTTMVEHDRLREDIENFRRAIQSGAPVAAAGHALYKLLLEPIESQLLGKRRIVIVADGALRLLPFEALATTPEENVLNFVLQQRPYHISYAHSVAVLAELKASRREAAASRAAKEAATDPRRALLLFADPAYPPIDRAPTLLSLFGRTDCASRPFKPLRGAAAEAAGLIRQYGLSADDPAVNLRERAIPDRLRELPLTDFRRVVFAMHGVLCRGEGRNGWDEPALAFSAIGPKASLLRLEDIYQLRFDADLITLSACETALGQDVNGEGTLGLTRAFLFAGAGAVVASLWMVDDAATAELMQDFNSRLDRDANGSPATVRLAHPAALQASKRWVAQTYRPASGGSGPAHGSHPFYWAAFVLYGLPD